MHKFAKIICLISLLTVISVAARTYTVRFTAPVEPTDSQTQVETAPRDTIVKPKFPVKKTAPQEEKDARSSSTDLKDPENAQTQAYYDEKDGTYRLGTKVGDSFVATPLELSPKEFQQWTLRHSLQAYYKQKNQELYKNKGKEKFDFTDLKFDLGPAAKIFGPGGVRIRTQGSAELKLGANMRSVENPSIAERNRKVFGFDFDEKINVSVNGKIGDKMGMDFNYNSDATFDFDAQRLKLQYQGKEDEIIKLIEAGNVSMPTNNSLIRGTSSLLGIRTDLQFGKLKLSTIIAQKKSATSSVRTKGGVQLSTFEFSADDYDENRHFFLAQYFRDHYDENMAQLPNILSGITINRAEVWVTNKTGQTTNTRNIIALTDLGEASKIHNPLWTPGSTTVPANAANTLYNIVSGINGVRNISTATSALDGFGLTGGVDYEKLESARLLSPSEYKVNAALGYISLRSALQPDQVLAVAFEYTYRGTNYQVGEFSTDRKDNTETLLLKSLKNTANSPSQGNWDLMMKNVYALGASNVQKEKFRLDVKYLSDTTGVYLNYLPEPTLKDKRLIQLLGLDRLDNNNKRNSNAYFDYVEGYTIDPTDGRVFFTSVEPFGKYLRKVIGNNAIADKYVFQELYDSTKTVAKQIAEKDKFIIAGQYKASREDEISLGVSNVPRGSVLVTAGGQTLVEGADYTVDYNSGVVRILNKSLLSAGTSINVSLESNTDYGMQRKTLLGLNWQYDFSKNFMIGGTIMHLGEKPLTTKVAFGSEAINNTIWGVNIAFKKQSQRLTDWIDKLPFVNATQPSSINFTAEFAQLIAGKVQGAQGNASYLDDFENATSNIDISNPKEWSISSTPSMFAESSLSNDVRYGYNRALLAWYYIDPLFTRRSSSLTPGYIKTDLDQLSDPDVREVPKSELFPNKQTNYKESTIMNVLNLAFYPNERGPYNLDPDLNAAGYLNNPRKRWGGMMRKLDVSDFENSNVEYIEFWMMDPFIKARKEGRTFTGELYFNLGEISEDILKDGKKFYESGMPIDGSSTLIEQTAWGKVPTQSSVTYAFNTTSGARSKQDIGLNGLTSEEEKTYPAYQNYLQTIRGIVSAAVYDSIAANPSGDRYHYFRGSDYDRAKKNILERYKYINNPNGNSSDTESSQENYATAYKTTPDVEDINQDYTLNEYEKYYQYRVAIDPNKMRIGENYIVDQRTAYPKTRNNKREPVNWYLFRIPIENYEKNVGGMNDFTSIRFIRMFLTGFDQPVVLRLATLNLVHGEWRSYDQALYNGQAPSVSGVLEPSSVNFEENNDKSPVNYVIPPGISRVIDSGQDQLLQNNEQALSLVVKNLASEDARAVYKRTNLDLRRYKHLQMFNHANSLEGYPAVEDGQVSLFVRLGSDYKSNFYEYEIPLTVTPPEHYANSDAGALAVWPAANMLDIDLSLFTDLKRNRNRARANGAASFGRLYTEYDPQKQANRVSIMGNPTLGDIRTIMIGVRNNSRQVQHAEVWVNELRLQQVSNKGGIAAQAALNLQLSDLATVDLTGHLETEGFGGLEETVQQRRDNNLTQYSVTTNVQLGKFLPEKVKMNAPLYYSYSKERIEPKYNPLDTDLPMKDALSALATKAEKDSLRRIANRVVTSKNLSLTGVRFNIQTKGHPMPYDPANFTFGYAHSSRETTGQTTAWEKDQNWRWSFNYNYSPNYKPFTPFKKISKSKWLKILTDFGFNYLPQNLAFNSEITRSYYELQERDMENLGNTSIPLTWNSDFLWNRSFNLRWDITKNIQLSFQSGTNAEIEQPYTAVNKQLYPDRYRAWKDSIWQSIRHLGRPLSYAQNFQASWRLPINMIPLFDWLTSDVSYQSSYNWIRGTVLENGMNLGNNISNSRNITANARLNMETLYNHIPFLRKVNQKYSNSNSSSSKKQEQKKVFTQELHLKADATLIVKHNQQTKKIRLTALRKDGSRMQLRYKVIDKNTIEILNRDSAQVKLTIAARKSNEDQAWYKTLQGISRVLMMVRNVSFNYSNRFNMSLPGFLPEIGNTFGQSRGGGLKPGLDFAFGAVNESYICRAAERGWLLRTDSIITPATTNLTETFQFRATLEPFRDFKIDLSATRDVNTARSIQYMFTDMPSLESGSFAQTTISIISSFESFGNADNSYASKTFRKFIQSLDSYRNQAEAHYANATYPAGTSLAGTPFNPANGTISKYSADVMVPAFLDAYTAGGSGLRIFPTILRMLPNWSISYAGLARLSAMKKVFKSFNLNHSYKSIYSVGAYSSFSTFSRYMGNWGFVTNVSTGLPVPSSPFDVSSVSINETFAPLFGVDMTFLNNLSTRVEIRRTRILTLSMTNAQINEARSNDFVIGMGYKIPNFKLFAAKKTVRTKKAKSKQTEENKAEGRSLQSSLSGFSSDLNVRFDFSFRSQASLNRDIMTGLSQATSGNRALQVSFSADYALSRLLTLTLYYDRQMNRPLLTSASYPTTTQDFGVSLKFSLNH